MVALGQVDLGGNDVAVRSIQVGAQLPGRFPATPATVTQATNRTTGVTINALSGTITTNNASLAAEAAAAFTVTNSFVGANDVIVISQTGSNGGNTDVTVTTVGSGSFQLKVSNNNAAAGTAETGAIVINFAVIKVMG